MSLTLAALNPGLSLDRLDLWFPDLDAMLPSLDDDFPGFGIAGVARCKSSQTGTLSMGRGIPTPVVNVAHSSERARGGLAGYDWITGAY